MNLAGLSLSGFRSYSSRSFEFDPKTNLIIGENGVGKTNLLEAIYILSGSRSFRSAKTAEMIKFGFDRADMTAGILSRGRDFEMKLTLLRSGKGQVFINDVKTVKKSKMSEIIRCVVFSPRDLFLIKGAAGERRDLLDGALCQKKAGYADALSRYEKVLAGKQKLLRDEGDLSVLPELNRQLAFYGAAIIENRAALCETLESAAKGIHKEISGGKEDLSLKYKTVSTVNDPFRGRDALFEILLARFEEMREAEIKKQCCLTGVQRDDIEVFINGADARAYASQGQARTAAVALKFSEREYLKEENEYPVMLLDDVMSELDAPRQEYIAGSTEKGQTFITCCETACSARPDKIIEITR